MKKSLLAGLAVASTIGFFTPLISHAFGLGKLELMSALNEPFKAEIDVTALSPTDKENLQVKIASNDEFVKAGLDRSILLGQLQFDIVDRQGKTKILVTSTQAVKEPFLDFLLTATAGSGRLLREYTVLLDPPEYVMAETRNKTASVLPASQVPETNTASTSTRTEYTTSSSASSYAVKRSDTLWNIALKTRPSSSNSVHQMMMALLRQNPHAFNHNNVNGLKAGVTLQIPDQGTISALSKSAAVAAFSEQAKAWKNRNTVTTVAAATEESSPSEGAQKNSPDTSPSESIVDEKTTASEAGADNEGRLQLVAPDDDVISEDDAAPNVAGNDQIQKLTEQLTLAQETIEAQQQENVDFESRMNAMEEQLETMRRLISLKDTDLARLQSQLEQDNAAQATSSDPELQTQNTATTESSETPLDEQKGMDEAELQTTELETSNASTLGDAQADSLIDDASTALNLDGEDVKSLLGNAKQFVIERKLETALGLILILLISWLLARRSSREVTWDEAVQKLDKNQQQDEGPVVVQPSPVDNEVDGEPENEEEKTVAELVEQADMFVGYADYVQAKNALDQARLQEPENTWVRYKMLFVLYKKQQADEFVTLVEESKFDQDSYEWDEIKQWGQELAPNHHLFASQSEQEAVETDVELAEIPEQTEIEDVSQDEKVSTEELETIDQDDDSPIAFDLNEFSPASVETDALETESEPSTAKDVDEHDDLLDFDSNFTASDNTDVSDTDETDDTIELDLTSDTSDDDLSFDLDLPDESDDLSADDFDTSDVDDDATDLEFDVGDLDDIDEAETKLDLAAAYIDMDDSEGASSILNEVLLEGNDEQKKRAHSLLDSLS
ncbi:FimV/HubP family polar landmark protein [Methylophaga thiooxydans]|uniref:FimV/HubP family polar landmark protein n=1 Tax=Methylophaga thiooxydans TaxID=392484 RepID=UPI002354FB1A|nr:FimV/HubP family polar landmark protein [Methylophaga thiooxydans]